MFQNILETCVTKDKKYWDKFFPNFFLYESVQLLWSILKIKSIWINHHYVLHQNLGALWINAFTSMFYNECGKEVIKQPMPTLIEHKNHLAIPRVNLICTWRCVEVKQKTNWNKHSYWKAFHSHWTKKMSCIIFKMKLF